MGTDFEILVELSSSSLESAVRSIMSISLSLDLSEKTSHLKLEWYGERTSYLVKDIVQRSRRENKELRLGGRLYERDVKQQIGMFPW